LSAAEESGQVSWNASEEQRIKISIEELKNLEWRAGMKLPEAILALDGREVEIEGYMNLGTPEGVETFQLVADSCGCDGRGNPHHFIEVTLENDVTAFNPDLITVHGTFEVGEVVEDGFVVSLFRLKKATIQ
ncbi:MAG: hypothetical protein AAF368_20320, partial [Planctomycetota bacterium]